MALLNGNWTPSSMLDSSNPYKFSPLYFHYSVHHSSANTYFVGQDRKLRILADTGYLVPRTQRSR